MSVPDAPQPPDPRPQGLGGCLVVLLILVGVVLILPGLCSLVFMIAMSRDGGSFGAIGGLWLITYVVAALGIALIVYAVKNR